ncbi:hypothetical protein CDAR_567991 [Caerostris darwini]|uniref:Uncharacterized protein n=1 Tax=Caerostris darwini TaxID=1538125 RepID=A0AAV4R5Q0_9ARAC|nr:hypothetical protein CDAR_567991 [Caerostris darwini]
MDTHSVSTLQFMCLTETVILLFNRTDIKKCLHKLGYHFLDPHAHLDCIEKRGKEFASTLPIPVSVKNALIDVLRSMATEVFDWCIKHRHFISEVFDVFSSFHWRSDGTIEELKTAQALIRREDGDIGSRFKIACYYLLTVDMQRLMEESPNTYEGLFKSLRQAKMMSLLARRRGYNSFPNNNFWQKFCCCICGAKKI